MSSKTPLGPELEDITIQHSFNDDWGESLSLPAAATKPAVLGFSVFLDTLGPVTTAGAVAIPINVAHRQLPASGLTPARLGVHLHVISIERGMGSERCMPC